MPKISRRCLADYVRKFKQTESVPHAQHDYFFLFILFNQLNSLSPTTRENNDLIAWIRKNNCAARGARFLVQFFDVACQMTISKFKSDFLRISRIGRHSRKIDFSPISPKHTFGWTYSRENSLKFPRFILRAKFGKDRNLHKMAVFAY